MGIDGRDALLRIAKMGGMERYVDMTTRELGEAQSKRRSIVLLAGGHPAVCRWCPHRRSRTAERAGSVALRSPDGCAPPSCAVPQCGLRSLGDTV